MVAIQPAPRKNIVDLRLLLIYTILSGDYENEKGVLPNFLNYFSKLLADIMRREKAFAIIYYDYLRDPNPLTNSCHCL